jgi:hypothetical protein
MKSSGLRIAKLCGKNAGTVKTLLALLLACAGMATGQKWIPVTTPQFPVGTALQLTDGTIMVQENRTSNWWRLTPDKFGHYNTGTWSIMPSMPAGYAPLFFASAVLKDGRVIVEGGEYNNGVKDFTTLGAIYDPFTDSWASVAPPPGWTRIGDAQTVVLPDGTFMLANVGNKTIALLDPSTMTWQVVIGPTKFDRSDEEGWTLLPNGNVLTVDTYLSVPYNPNGMNSEIYDTTSQTWSSAGSTVVQLWDSKAACGGPTGATHEIGPAVLRPDGTVFATGSNTCPSTAGHTAIYNTLTGTWTAGPDIPGIDDAADASASILVTGNVLLDTNPGWGKNPSTFYEFNGSGFVKIPQPTGLNPSNTEGGRMLVTSAGTVLFLHVSTNQVWVYKPAGTYLSAWRPTICAACYPATCIVGGTYTVSGTQFNGLTQGAAFGDDAQSATNFPLVQITNNATGHKFFARTHDFSTMAVATGATLTSTQFDILPTTSGTEFGASTLVVIANGIPSKPVGIIVEQ